jgi:hypothetical protein
MKSWGKKYNLGGITPVSPGTNATSEYVEPERVVDDTDAKTQVQVGNTISTVGALASLIPGYGTAIGAGLGAIGSIVSSTASPTVYNKPIMNSKPYGFKYGGRYAMGGDLNKLSEEAVHVDADNPNMTDSVGVGNIMLDDNEVVTGNKVFSDSIINPMTKRTFAEDEKMNQKKLGNFQKMKNKMGDTEYKDDKYLEANSEKLFKFQESLANRMGLRDPNGMPKQFKYGGKMKYFTGGPGGPINPTEDDIFTSNAIINSLIGAQTNIKDVSLKGPFNRPRVIDPKSIKYTRDYAPQFGESGTGNVFKKDYGRPRSDAEMEGLLLRDRMDSATKAMPRTLEIPGLDLNISSPMIDFNTPTVDLTTGVATAIPKTVNEGAPTLTSDFTSRNVMGDTSNITDPNNTSSLNDSTTTAQKGPGMFDFVKEHPFGTIASGIGVVSNAASMLGDVPSFVNYSNIGRAERQLQDRARREVLLGKSQALQDALAQGRVARKNLQGRNFSGYQANLRNIASGVTQSMNNIRGQYAKTLANMDTQFGQRRTQVEAMNRQKDMQVDQINTQEMDATRQARDEKWRNIRRMGIELQNSKNAYDRNRILRGLLGTKNFKFDMNDPDMIKFVSSVYNVK